MASFPDPVFEALAELSTFLNENVDKTNEAGRRSPAYNTGLLTNALLLLALTRMQVRLIKVMPRAEYEALRARLAAEVPLKQIAEVVEQEILTITQWKRHFSDGDPVRPYIHG